MRDKAPVWSWRDAIRQTDVPPLTKLVCLTIACYLSDAGKGWRITVKDLMRDTGLATEAMSRHLRNAQDAGLIVIRRQRDAKGYRTTTEYLPAFPNGCTLARRPAEVADLNSPPERRRLNSGGERSGGERQVSIQVRKTRKETPSLSNREGVGRVLACGGNI